MDNRTRMTGLTGSLKVERWKGEMVERSPETVAALAHSAVKGFFATPALKQRFIRPKNSVIPGLTRDPVF